MWSSEPEYHLAVKAHRCSWCGEEIEDGTRYARWRNYGDGEAGTSRVHLECEAAFQQALKSSDVHEIIFYGDAPRGGASEPFDVTTYEQALAAYEASLPVPEPRADGLRTCATNLKDLAYGEFHESEGGRKCVICCRYRRSDDLYLRGEPNAGHILASGIHLAITSQPVCGACLRRQAEEAVTA